MDKSIFRQKSLDRISSPEALNDYVKVATPGVWTVLVAIILLLLGVCAWGVFGKLETKYEVGVSVDNGKASCYCTQQQISHIKKGMEIQIDDKTGTVTSIGQTPVDADDLSSFIRYLSGNGEAQWLYAVECDVDLADGEYKGTVVVDSVSPMSFVTN